MKNKTVVIGAGDGGLMCAAKLAKAGLDVILLEHHDKVGGYAQGWTIEPKLNNGRRVRASLEVTHAISNLLPGMGMHNHFTDLGVDWGMIGGFHSPEGFARMKAAKEGSVYEMSSSMKHFKAHLMGEYPEEKRGIAKFFRIMDKISDQVSGEGRMPGVRKFLERSLEGRLKSDAARIPLYCLTKHSLVWRRNWTFQDYLDSCFKSEKIKFHLSALMGYMGVTPKRASGTLTSLMMMSYFNGGGPLAPSHNSYQAMHDELARVFVEKHGGDLRLYSKVEEIKVEDGKVKGVRVKGRGGDYFIEADCVVCAGDMKRMLLPLKDHMPKKYADKLESMKMSMSFMSTHAIIEKDLSGMEDELGFAANVLCSSEDAMNLFERLDFPNDYVMYVSVPTLLRPEAGLLTDMEGNALKDYHIMDIVMPDPESFEYWNKLRCQGKRHYVEAKKKPANAMIDIVDRELLPGLKDAVRFVDISTAKTYERFCLTTDGAAYSFEQTPQQFVPNRPSPKTPIDGLYVTGAAVLSAGVTGALSAGIMTSESILKNL